MKRVRFHTVNTGRFERAKGTKLGVDFALDSLAQVEILVAPSGMQIDLAIVVRSSHVDQTYWMSCI